ncbi:MAG: class I SAM-dependent methyltransferase [Flavobacteriales bacterium]|nr:class I SAM-dependent methyltransferase [Flavobacteriales bacterium]NNK81324.1 class I SAM-dependent methyltransferase [Flavobacteriales bacterium]
MCVQISGQEGDTTDSYTYSKGDPYGIGKWYMGREIAYVMGYDGMDWLERPERDEEEDTSKLIKNLDIESYDVIADIGAGSGYHVFRMSPLTKDGKVYAVDIQEEMLEEIRKVRLERGQQNVEVIKGTETSVNLPGGSIDKVLMVDVYHEFEYPREMMESISHALKDDGEIFLVEYRGEDAWVPIKKVHKMSKGQAVKEMEAVGFKLKKNIGNLPWQHCMVFVKDQ